MTAVCPRCNARIPADDLNAATDVALCRGCGQVARLSMLVQDGSGGTILATEPPDGAWCRDDGLEVEIGASTQSWLALFLIPFAAVWSGVSLGGIYGSQFSKGTFNPVLSLFGIPFLLGTAFLGGMVAMTLCGRVVVRLRGGNGEVFTGIGPVGWRRSFEPAEVRRVYEDTGGWSRSGRPQYRIVLEGPRRLAFGTMLSEDRRYSVMSALRRALARR